MKTASNYQSETRQKKLVKYFSRTLMYLFAVAIAITALVPFVIMIISSTHGTYDIVAKINFLPGTQFLRNLARLTEYTNIKRGILNSFIIACTATSIKIYFTAMAGYAFAKFNFKGKNVLFSIILIAMMLPGQISIIGSYKQIQDMGLMDSYFPLIIPAIADCFAVFFYKQFLDGSLPNEMIEAAIADGAAELTIFHKIVIPLMSPAIVTQAVMGFIGSWNSYLQPLIYLTSKSKMTLPLMIASVRDATHADYGAQYVGMVISIIPLVILFSFSSKVIMNNISVGAAIKG